MSCRRRCVRMCRDTGATRGENTNCDRRYMPTSDALEDAFMQGYNKGYCDGVEAGREEGFCEGFEQGAVEGCQSSKQQALDCIRNINCY